MKVAVALNEKKLDAIVPNSLEEAMGVMIVETDTMEIVDFATKSWVDTMDDAFCEALMCGDIYNKDLFESIALRGITRYFAGGMTATDAIRDMMAYKLKFITDFVGGTGCDDDHGECKGEHGDEDEDCTGDCASCTQECADRSAQPNN